MKKAMEYLSKKLSQTGICLIFLFLTFAFISRAAEKKITIGISQIVEHPSLDEDRQGILDGLKSQGYDETKVNFIYKNAQGDFPTAQLISKELNDKADIIVAIATPSAQAAVNAIKTKPIFFSVVAYPESAGILQPNVTGASNKIPAAKHVELIKTLLPNIKKIGIIYNASENNSVETVEEFSKNAKKAGYEIILRTITNVNDVSSALDSILGEIDVLYSTNDNMIASAYPIVVDKCKNKNIPIISAVKNFVDQGALATEYISEYDVGFETGLMIAKYINGEKIENMPYVSVSKSTRLINPDIAKKFGVKY
ncbi:MAG: ABC transporter substrate-binding protein [Fusobacteriaceae bacterium]|jgi:putative ABC transport system substrate-binding protein|nr:ABC transporter substrate-binding protein [Fusobacteriaceae bacterium]